MADESIFITGAGSGMGRLAARTFAEQGYPVAAVDVNEKGLLEIGLRAGVAAGGSDHCSADRSLRH